MPLARQGKKIYTPQQASANNETSDHTSIGIYQLPIISNYVKYVYVTRRASVELYIPTENFRQDALY